MPGLHTERIRIERVRRNPQTRIWREWCFVRAALQSFGKRFLVMAVILLTCGILFQVCEPRPDRSFPEAVFFGWSLVFGQPPEDFPDHVVLQILFFLMPVVGLTVIIEGLIDFTTLLRDRRRAERSWCRIMSKSLHDHVILVGLGRLGFRVYRLLRKLGEPMVVIENDPNCEFLDDVRRDGVPLFIADARREAYLHDANARDAKSIIAATNNDLANLEIALDARRINPNIRVVLRMFDQNVADKVRDGFKIRIAMSQAAISAPSFAMAAVESDIVGSFVMGDRLVIVLNWAIDAVSPLAGRSIGDLIREKKIGVVEYRPVGGEKQLFPSPDQVLSVGDQLLVQGLYESIDELRVHAIAPEAMRAR
ncbi:MAG: NAD-binding protein [Phycisphaerales bacterium]|nr:NAD-binding protein [Phycisphaerales bacterium]